MYRRGDYVTVTINNEQYLGRIESGCIEGTDVNITVKYIPASAVISATVPLADIQQRNTIIPIAEIDEKDN